MAFERTTPRSAASVTTASWKSVNAAVNDLIFGNQGNDTLVVSTGGSNDTVFGGLGDDTMVTQQAGQIFGNEGNDTIDAHETDFANDRGRQRFRQTEPT